MKKSGSLRQFLLISLFLITGLIFYVLSYVAPENIKSAGSSYNVAYKVPETLPEISFSKPGGFYSEPFDLEMSTGTKYSIRYTYNMDQPGAESEEYNGPVRMQELIDKTSGSADGTRGVVIRAALFDGDKIAGKIYTRTYIFKTDIQQRFTLPVISLVTEKKNLFDYYSGIYVEGKIFDDWRKTHPAAPINGASRFNYTARGIEWERPVHIEFFNEKGETGLDQDAGLRIFGGASRLQAQKSFRIIARDTYGSNTINCDLIPGLTSDYNNTPINSYDRFILRNSGNDYYSSMIRDAMMQRLAEGTGVAIQQYRPVIVYLNGVYWGILNIREDLDSGYVSSHYGIDGDKATFLKNGVYDSGPRDGYTNYKNMVTYITKNNPADPSVYHKINTMMDTENFLRYCAIQVYYGNADWPQNNVRQWKYNTWDGNYDPDAPYGADGRWRWMLKDTDPGFGMWIQYGHNTLGHLIKTDSVFSNLCKNKDFKNDFINFSCDLLNDKMLPDNVIQKINSMQLGIALEIPTHIKKWKDSSGKTVLNWDMDISRMRTFAKSRPSFILKYLKSNFKLSEPVTLKVKKSEGSCVKINTIDLNTTKAFRESVLWEGRYFSSVPVKISAAAKPGYKFYKWQVSGDAILLSGPVVSVNSIVLTGDAELTAIYMKNGQSSPAVQPCAPEKVYSHVVTMAAKNRVFVDGKALDKSIVPLQYKGAVYVDLDELRKIIKFESFLCPDVLELDGRRYAPVENIAKFLKEVSYWDDNYKSVIISRRR